MRTTGRWSGTSHRAVTSTPPPGNSSRPSTRPLTPSARTTSRCTSHGSGRSSTPRASRRNQRLRPVHRLPHQIPHQAARRLPHRQHRRPGRPHRPAHRRAAVRALLPGVRELAPLGIQPRNPRPGLRPGHCKGKAHRREHLGYAGRRVLVSRKWSGKTLADHRADRKTWLMEALNLPADNTPAATPGDASPPPIPTTCPPARPSCTLTDRARWQTALTEARRTAQEAADLPATGRAASRRAGSATADARGSRPCPASRP